MTTQLKIAVNKRLMNKEVANVASGWKNVYVTTEWLMGWVASGYAWCATHFYDHYRKSDNVDGSNAIIIDFDGDTTLDNFWATTTAQEWCSGTYTSASHTEEEHRFRAIFPLEAELSSPNQHKGAYWLVVNRLLAELELNELKDNCGQKAERLWFGNTSADTRLCPDNFVPAFLLEDIDYEDNVFTERPEITTQDAKRCSWLLREFLRPSDDGEYESYYVPVMAACAGIGQEMFDDWVEWVLKGHHGEKPENILAFKWRGLGNISGHTTLYSLAKKQDPNWTKQLPPHLKFTSTGAAAGYSEVDPVVELDTILDTKPLMNQPDNDIAFPEPLPDTNSGSKKRGRPKRSGSDMATERENDVNQVKDILTDLRKNELTGTIEYTDKAGTTVELQGNDLDLMTTKLACEYGVFIPEQRVKSAVQYAAGRNQYCPIRRYLDHCSAHAIPHTEWEKIGEIFLGNKHKLATTTMQRMMIGAVARAMNPGCTMSWLPILVGAQGVGKSMFARSLVPQKLFTEISTPLETLIKEQYRLHVGWLLELPEVDNYFNIRNIENFKNLITTRVDEVRYPYASLPSKLPRRFVMIGTTNRNQFLVDSTGNRRFVPLEVATQFLIPWQRLAEERDSLWAAAVKAYREGQPYEFTAGEIAEIAEYIQEFGDPDPWMEKIINYIQPHEEVTAADVLTKALELDPRQQGRRESRRVADVLQSVGWRRKVTSRKDKITGKSKSVRVWIRPQDDPLPENSLIHDF